MCILLQQDAYARPPKVLGDSRFLQADFFLKADKNPSSHGKTHHNPYQRRNGNALQIGQRNKEGLITCAVKPLSLDMGI